MAVKNLHGRRHIISKESIEGPLTSPTTEGHTKKKQNSMDSINYSEVTMDSENIEDVQVSFCLLNFTIFL